MARDRPDWGRRLFLSQVETTRPERASRRERCHRAPSRTLLFPPTSVHYTLVHWNIQSAEQNDTSLHDTGPSKARELDRASGMRCPCGAGHRGLLRLALLAGPRSGINGSLCRPARHFQNVNYLRAIFSLLFAGVDELAFTALATKDAAQGPH